MTVRTKKIILWSVTAILAVSLLFLWVKNSQKRLESFRAEKFLQELNLPEINYGQEETSTQTE